MGFNFPIFSAPATELPSAGHRTCRGLDPLPAGINCVLFAVWSFTLYFSETPSLCLLFSKDQMALRGVWQLNKLIVSYCDWGGSSRGIRAFMESHLPALKEKNPQLEVVTELIRGQHPHLKGFYKNKNQRVICVKNMDPEDILLHATRLRNALGRKVVKLRTRHVTKHPSVQGTWTTALKF
ncbi:hypothetical protein VNO77_25201 [Canavalia gladiata]|uniref:Large ribosomal subunit protein mL43 n=1 Tax=Canavalia gladiata TaxID=3824 RepID=A0AAN9QGX4_CANGL